MAELFKILFGVITGTITYVIVKFILDNLLEQKRIVHEIGFCLIEYATIYLSGIHNVEKAWEVSRKFGSLATEIYLTINKIPFYNSFEKTNLIYPKSVIEKVSKLLIELSHNMWVMHIPKGEHDFGKENRRNAEEIGRLLKIEITLNI